MRVLEMRGLISAVDVAQFKEIVIDIVDFAVAVVCEGESGVALPL